LNAKPYEPSLRRNAADAATSPNALPDRLRGQAHHDVEYGMALMPAHS